MKDWSEDEYNALCWKSQAVETRLKEMRSEAERLARSLEETCARITKFQQVDDLALQSLHAEVGQLEGAENQQRLGALLISSTEPDPANQTVPLRLTDTTTQLLVDMVSGIRARGRRFNATRLREWLSAAATAALGNDRQRFERAMVGLQAELRRTGP